MTRSIRLIIFLPIAAAFLNGAPVRQQFETPQEAAHAIVDAAERNDAAAMLKIFGPEGKDIVESGDATEDKESRAAFAKMAHEKLEVEQDPGMPNRAMLVVGSNNWPFPVPLIRKDGKWQFDPARGRLEILARRVGRNELNAIEVCRGYVEAQMVYAEKDWDGDGILEYAQRIISSPGKKDGLYWDGAPEGLVPKAFVGAAAADLAAGKLAPYHGYYFRILKAQGPDAPGGALSYVVKGEMIGGFALVAWPAEYSVSGVKTFIVSHHGLVYERDLGANTAAQARQMTAFNPDKKWKPVEKE